VAVGNIDRRALDIKLLRFERSFEKRNAGENPERFALRLHRGRVPSAIKMRSIKCPDRNFRPDYLVGGCWQDRRIVEKESDLSNRLPWFVRIAALRPFSRPLERDREG
jgi:hypothetical protein